VKNAYGTEITLQFSVCKKTGEKGNYPLNFWRSENYQTIFSLSE